MTALQVNIAVSCTLLFGCVGPPGIETNTRNYTAILNEWEASGLVDHFPKSLPPTTSKMKFSSFPGYLQGGAWIQVRFQLPAAEIKDVFDEASQQARQFHDGGDATTLVDQRPDGLFSTSFHTSNSGEKAFPADYRVFIFDAEPYKVGSDFDWNHGNSRGIAVSIERNEVIYWAENW